MTPTAMREAVQDVRAALADPVRLCNLLDVSKGAQRQAGGLLICCPVHGERHPSCSVTRGPDGTVRVRCHACGWTADAIGFVAAVHGLSTRGDGFRETLAVAAELGGLLALADELRGGKPSTPHVRPPPPAPLPARVYPPAGEVSALWDAAQAVTSSANVSRYLESRAIDPDAVQRLDLARALVGGALPRWARYQGEAWTELGFLLVLPMFDAAGALRSVRAWRVTEGDGPKRLPPAGHRATELVMANGAALAMLRGEAKPARLLVLEGEPDYLTAATRYADPALGIVSGSWSEAFAARVPSGCDVAIWTHADRTGERYAAELVRTLADRCSTWRAA